MTKTIVLIGPMCAGKSTIASLLAEHLQLPRFELDELRWDYYSEIGYDKEAASKAAEEKGLKGLLAYWKPYEVHAVERVLADHTNCVIDFGAGHSVFENKDYFGRVQNALSALEHVLLFLPTTDLNQSIEILNGRLSLLLEKELGKAEPDLLESNVHFVSHPSNYQLATHIFYTEGKTPQETCEEVLSHINNR